MSKRHSDASHATTYPKRGFYILQDPAAGATEKFDAGTIDDLRNALAPAQALSGTGIAGARIANGPVFGLNPFTVAVSFNPTSLASTNLLVSGGSGALTLYVLATGAVLSGKRSNTDNSASASGAVVAGVTNFITYTRGADMVGRYYVNRVLVGTTTDTKDYDAAIYTLGMQDGGGQPLDGTLRLIGIENRALSASEISELNLSGGVWPTSDYKDATQSFGVSTLIGANSDFSAVGEWAGTGDISGNKLNLASGYKIIYGKTIPGRRYRATLVIDANPTSIVVDNGGTKLYEGALKGTGPQIVEFVSAGGGAFEVYSAATAAAVIDSITIVPIGLVCAPEANAPGNGAIWNDRSGVGATIILPLDGGKLNGVAWALPDSRANKVFAKSNTPGDEALFGVGCMIFATVSGNPSTRITSVLARALTGAPTVKLGYVSGGNQYATATALDSNWKVIPAGAESFTATSSLWANSTTADVVEWCIVNEPIKF